MLKKIYFSLILLLIIFWPNFSQAFSEKELKDRYSGSILLTDTGWQQQFWYVEPSTQMRYAIDSQDQLDNIIKKFSLIIKDKDLQKIPSSDNQKGIDYNLSQKYRGQFIVSKQKNTQTTWYVNPLDLKRYQLDPTSNTLEFIHSLAIDINAEKLDYLSLADLEQLNVVPNQVDFANYFKIYDTLKQNYYKSEKIDATNLFYGSLQGLVDAVDDPYTEFFTPKSKKQFDDTLSGTTEGIGAMVDIKDGLLTIITPLDNMPAAKAGLLPYDQILMVDDKNIKGLSLAECITLIKGPSGTNVKLNIYRPSTNKNFDVIVTRAKIIVPNVTGKKIEAGITYIKINNFAMSLPGEFYHLSQQLIDNNTRGVIIDLRNNPGGYTDSAVFLADQWLDANQIIFKEKFPKSLQEYKASSPVEIKLPTVILVNNGSASAAEIFTAALKNHAKAKIVGEKTFGKGTGQAITAFPDGSAIKYTIFEWLDPANNSIEKTGVKPDIEVISNPMNGFDNQLEKAIQVLTQ